MDEYFVCLLSSTWEITLVTPFIETFLHPVQDLYLES